MKDTPHVIALMPVTSLIKPPKIPPKMPPISNNVDRSADIVAPTFDPETHLKTVFQFSKKALPYVEPVSLM